MLAVGVTFTAAGAYATYASFGLAAPASVPVTVLGITMTSQAAAYVATGVLAAGTVLGAASTAATAYGAAKGDDTALRIGEYVGYAAIPLDVGGMLLKSAVKSALKATTKALDQGSKILRRSLDDLQAAPGIAARRGSAPANLAVPGLVRDGEIPRASILRGVPPQPNPRPTKGPNARVNQQSATNTAASSGPSWLLQRTAFLKPIPGLGPDVFQVIRDIRMYQS